MPDLHDSWYFRADPGSREGPETIQKDDLFRAPNGLRLPVFDPVMAI